MKSFATAATIAAAVFGGMWFHYHVFEALTPWAFVAAVVVFFVLASVLLPINLSERAEACGEP
ncbi:MAG TPA: hypothetical protein VLG28_02020 [Acidimicrobiia bacterium]|jgi:hypothetical protein|nr:hypothetical protein [Acidimicrobiia bacterium]